MLDHVHVRLLTCHFSLLSPDWWHFQQVQDSFWRFYVHDGEGASIEHAGQHYPLLPGRFHFVPAGIRFNTSTMNRVGQLFAHFDVLGLPSLTRRALFSAPISLLPVPALEHAANTLLQDVRAAQQTDLILHFRVKALIYNGLASYLQSLPSEQLQNSLQQAGNIEPILPALRYIETNIASQLLISELARLCHVQVDYFTRRFRECIGQTPGQYIQEQRVKLAAELLLFSDQSIEQIAANAGFGNRYYFSRVFTRHIGIPPATYRQSTRYR